MRMSLWCLLLLCLSACSQPSTRSSVIPSAPSASPTTARTASAATTVGATRAATPNAATTPPNTATDAPANTETESNVAQARAQLEADGQRMVLLVVSSDSTGVAGEVYRDLRTRNIRATTGPDEGIDTRSLQCYPACLFVPIEEVNALSVAAWVGVLRHEYRHVVQATHNPNLASDFRAPDGQFTSYAAFSEACADEGLNVAPYYRAAERMGQLRGALAEAQSLIETACSGDKTAFAQVVQAFNRQHNAEQAFAQLFPPYR